MTAYEEDPGVRVVDVFPFFNEIEILRARLSFLAGHVDVHIASEMDVTHQGDPKPFLLDLDAVGAEFPDITLLSVRYTAFTVGEATDGIWQRERRQRDGLLSHGWLQPDASHHIHPDDLVLSCDVDELVDPDALPAIAKATESGPVRLGMRMLYYGLDWEDPAGWAHPVAFRARDTPESLSELRLRPGLPGLSGCGWHVSYWGGLDRRRTKVEAFAHAENRAPEVWRRIETGDVTGTGPNGEQLVPAADIPPRLRELLG